jgi:hypothetical protein
MIVVKRSIDGSRILQIEKRRSGDGGENRLCSGAAAHKNMVIAIGRPIIAFDWRDRSFI